MGLQKSRIELLKQAEIELVNGHIREALDTITQCLNSYPAFSPARVLQAEILMKSGKDQHAVDVLTEIIAATPDNIRARKLIIEALIELREPENAKSHLEFLEFMMPENDPDLLVLQNKLDGVFKSRPVSESQEIISIIEDDYDQDYDADTKIDIPLIDFDQDNSVPETINMDDEISQKNDIVTVTLDRDDKESESTQEPHIKTRTLATIYEKQGMFQEALDILMTIHKDTGNSALLKDIRRLEGLAGGSMYNYQERKKNTIDTLNQWLEKIHAV